jgi:hypothetical protein
MPVLTNPRHRWSPVIRVLLLLLGACSPGQAPGGAAAGTARIVSVFSRRDPPPIQQFSCAEGRCERVALEDFSCPWGARAEVLIVSGHSVPPVYLHDDPERLARVARCYRPGLIVLDTCYGFSLPLLEALAEEAPAALVVGATYKLPPDGLLYGEGFFQESSAEARAAHVRTRSGKPLQQWHLDRATLRRAQRDLDTWDVSRLEAHLVRKHPNLVGVALEGSEATALVPVEPARFRRP